MTNLDILNEYKKQIKRLQNAAYRLRKKGIVFIESPIPKRPKVITEKTVEKLRKIKPINLEAKGYTINVTSGELIKQTKKKAISRRKEIYKQRGIQAAKTLQRKLNRIAKNIPKVKTQKPKTKSQKRKKAKSRKTKNKIKEIQPSVEDIELPEITVWDNSGQEPEYNDIFDVDTETGEVVDELDLRIEKIFDLLDSPTLPKNSAISEFLRPLITEALQDESTNLYQILHSNFVDPASEYLLEEVETAMLKYNNDILSRAMHNILNMIYGVGTVPQGVLETANEIDEAMEIADNSEFNKWRDLYEE